MAKGITYFCNDKHGNLYTRYSAGETQPRYTAAAIYREAGTTDPVGKNMVSYMAKRRMIGRPYANTETEVVDVRAYQGRHKVEPVREPSDDEVDAGVLAGLKEQKTFRQHIQEALASDEEVGVIEVQIEPVDEGFEVYLDGSAKGVFPTIEEAQRFALKRKRGF
jgi:hypothetical protein